MEALSTVGASLANSPRKFIDIKYRTPMQRRTGSRGSIQLNVMGGNAAPEEVQSIAVTNY